MNSALVLTKECQKIADVLKGYADIFSGIGECLSASTPITEAIKKVAKLNTFPLSDEFIEQMNKLSSLPIKNQHAIGIIPFGGGYSLPTYESNFNSFEPSTIRIRIVVDND